MKKYIIITVILLISGYLIASYVYFNPKEERATVCKEVKIVVTDSLDKHFLTQAEVIAILKKANKYPLNKKIKDINTDEIEKILKNNEIVNSAEVFHTVSGKIIINISQKMPILRIFTESGSYYVDMSGKIMPTIPGKAIYVPVASGNINKAYAVSKLYEFALYLQKENFFNSLIEQIYVKSETDVEIIPRTGSHRILLGSLDDYADKLSRLQTFYEQVIPKMGWDKYSAINLKYNNQIVCTKK
ncbi:MAG: cell division protein FtsQ [Tannerella sp.]|jgi:cell division protein FtsQ|nr:cell division protein FtsQ [Tannerella sp.]